MFSPVSKPNNIRILIREMDWLAMCIQQRIPGADFTEELPAPPLFEVENTAYSGFIEKHQFGKKERLILSLCLATQLQPELLAELNLPGNPAKLVQYEKTGAFLPTVHTGLYLLAGRDTAKRITHHQLFDASHTFYRKSILGVGTVPAGVPATDGLLMIDKSYLDLFTTGTYKRPRFSHEFPAHLLETELEWEDLVLSPSTIEQIEEIKAYLNHNAILKNDPDLGKHVKPGFRCLFHGPSGTGKTLATALIGKHIGRDVYRIDLSAVISKYIGETSKNLNSLFNQAEDKNWILFFDEGDALFGKRMDTGASQDKNTHFANQDIAFLLQKIESYPELVIVATNLANNMDKAFARRFQCQVSFSLPKPEDRIRLWRDNLPKGLQLPPGIAVEQLAQNHTFSAASILKVIHRVSLKTLQKDRQVISQTDLNRCLADEKMNQSLY